MSDSVRPQRRQPTRLPRPWDSPGKNTGVGCHFLLQRMKVKSESEVAQSFPTLSDPMDCSPPGSSIHGIFQARVLEWGAIAFSEIRVRQIISKIIPILLLCWFRNLHHWPDDRHSSMISSSFCIQGVKVPLNKWLFPEWSNASLAFISKALVNSTCNNHSQLLQKRLVSFALTRTGNLQILHL